MPEGTLTFLFTDIESSTRLWQEQSEQMPQALAEHDEIMRSAILDNRGYVFATGGDGFAAAFASVTDAVEAAAVGQLGLLEHRFFRVRMGLHTGEAQLRDGDYFGAAVNKAARVMAAGHGGQTLMSAATATLVEGHPVKNLGAHHLRDLEGETVLWQLGTDDFAALRTLDQLPGNLPVQRTSFIGRVDDVKAIQELLDEARLVTLVGPGGVGKSRLALQVAAELSAEYSGGAWFVSLGSLTEPDLVADELTDALGLGERRGETAAETLVRWFATSEAMLVVDNCEHLLDAVAAIVDRLLDVDSGSRILATSQASLSLPGEMVCTVEPLASGGLASESVQLFVERARAVRSTFQLTEDNEGAIIEICNRLDHLPLAIELAASRAKAMTPADIARRLDARFRLLASGDRGVPDRQRTLEAAMRWSYELLDDLQQTVLRRLSVFVAPFTIDAAEAVVADDDTVEAWEVLDALLALVDKSLLVAREHGDTTRYHLLESVRQFGRAELDAEGDLRARSSRYADHFTAHLQGLIPDFMSPADQEALGELDREWEHVRFALRAAVEDDFSRFEELLDGLAPMFLNRNLQREGILWAAEVLDRPVHDPVLRVRNLAMAAVHAQHFDFGQADELLAEIERLSDAHGLSPSPLTRSVEAMQAVLQGDNDQAGRFADAVFDAVDPATAKGFEQFQALNNAYSVRGVIGEGGSLQDWRVFLRRAEEIGAAWVRCSAAASFSLSIHELDPENALDFLSRHLELAARISQYTVLPHAAMFHGLQLLRTGDVVGASASLALAVTTAAERCPSYIGQNANTTIAITMRQWPRTATVMLGGLERWRRDRRQIGTTPETEAELHYEQRLRHALGGDFDACRQRGKELSEAELVRVLLAALRAIEDGTMSDDLIDTLDAP